MPSYFVASAFFTKVKRGLRRHHGEHEARITPILNDGDHGLVLGLHLDRMLKGAEAHLRAAADDRLERTGAARHVEDLDIKAGVLEVAEPLGHRQG
jgi:hypothetical protein